MRPHVDLIVLLALVLLLFGATDSANPRRTYHELLTDERIEEKFRLLDASSLLDKFKVADSGARNRIGHICTRDLEVYEAAIGKQEFWAQKMLDASSKIPTGILEGNIMELGSYDGCVKTRAETVGIEIRGRHCTYEINPSVDDYFLPCKPLLSICLPDSCSAEDVTGLVNIAINTTDKLKELGVTTTISTCSRIEQHFWDTETTIWGSILGIYIGFIALCTACHLFERPGAPKKNTGTGLLWTLKRFSLLRSAKAIFSDPVHEDDLPYIHGIRVLCSFTVVMGHEYFVTLSLVNHNVLDILEWFSSWRSVHVLLGALSVDTFFTISGFLMTYTFFKKIQKNGKFNIAHHYLHRFIRLSLPLMVIMLVMVVFLPKFGSGPRWDWLQSIYITGCRSKWWTVLLYIQNYVERDNYCAMHFWYLSVDMQLFWLSPLILYPLYKRPKLGLTIIILLFLTSVILSALIVGVNQYRALYAFYKPEIPLVIRAFKDVYLVTHTRASPWLLGILLGFEVNCKNRKLTKTIIRAGWIYSATILITYIIVIRYLTSVSYEYSPPLEIGFAAIYRPVWSLVICWIIYACLHKSAGPVSKFLSHKFFLPLSRISYAIYLVHLFFPVLRMGTERIPAYFDNYSTLLSYVNNLCCSIVAAFFFSITFEIPALLLDDMIFRRKASNTADKARKTS